MQFTMVVHLPMMKRRNVSSSEGTRAEMTSPCFFSGVSRYKTAMLLETPELTVVTSFLPSWNFLNKDKIFARILSILPYMSRISFTCEATLEEIDPLYNIQRQHRSLSFSFHSLGNNFVEPRRKFSVLSYSDDTAPTDVPALSPALKSSKISLL